MADDRRRPDKLSAIVFSGDFARVHYALVMASAAAAVGTPATLFFTMEACRALLRPGIDGKPPWTDMPAGVGEGTGGDLDRVFRARAVATFEELLGACVQLGVRFMVCEMGLRALGIERAQLRDDVPIEEGGVVTFLADASSDGAMLFL